MAFISIQVEDELVERLDDAAKKMGDCSRAAVVRAAISFFLSAKSAKSASITDSNDKADAVEGKES
jgi:predicted transcriptional regulator